MHIPLLDPTIVQDVPTQIGLVFCLYFLIGGFLIGSLMHWAIPVLSTADAYRRTLFTMFTVGGFTILRLLQSYVMYDKIYREGIIVVWWVVVGVIGCHLASILLWKLEKKPLIDLERIPIFPRWMK